MKWIVAVIAGAWIFHQSAILGMLVQPWAPWWFSQTSRAGGGEVAAVPDDFIPPAPLPEDLSPVPGFVSDAQRYQLARAVGFSANESITAAAISMAEDGSGNPSIVSPANWNGTRDLGLWQINSNWWSRFGGPDALIVPINNARAAFAIKNIQGWCAWSTYGPCPTHACGPPCYSDFLKRARDASAVPPPTGQA